MKRSVQRFLLLSMLLFVSACSFDENLLTNKESDNPHSLDELTNVEYFRSGALAHILEGELNRKGQAVGFHYEGFPTSKGEVIEGTKTDLDEHGIYEAKVKVDGIAKQSNRGRSTFFPEEWTAQDVVDAINEAYEQKELLTGNTYAGMTEEGIVVHMYLDEEEDIISAFPIY